MVGRILDHVPGHTRIGRGRNFVHLVTGHTPGRINRNGTVHYQDGPPRQLELEPPSLSASPGLPHSE